MKIVFMGTPDFAVPALNALIKEHDVVCVYTRAPKMAGRGNKLTKTPIHLVAEANGIEVRTPKTLRDDAEQAQFAALKADIAIVAAYGLILPKPILEAFPLGCINLHASILPRWRGAAPIQRAVEAGDNESGVTIMQMDEGLDTGAMRYCFKTQITPNMTGGELHDKLAEGGAEAIIRVLHNLEDYPPQPQPENGTCYAQKIDKAECLIDFNASAHDLYNKIRAFNPFPAMFFEHNGERFKVLRTSTPLSEPRIPQGKIVQQGNRLFIGCADTALEILQIQRQGKKTMPTAELLRGYTF